MMLRVLLPDRLLYEGRAAKVVAETTSGSRGFLPQHIDFVAPLRQGILISADLEGKERYFAVDRGVLVKKGARITVTTTQGVMAEKLDALQAAIQKARAEQDEHERASQRALVQLETRLVREFLELVR